DWLALRFMQPAADASTSSGQADRRGCGWSIKAMHRMIMLSAVYQMSGDELAPSPLYSGERVGVRGPSREQRNSPNENSPQPSQEQRASSNGPSPQPSPPSTGER